jgi:hypothetical protein
MMAMAYCSICNFIVFSAMLKTVDGAVGDTGRKHIAVGRFTLVPQNKPARNINQVGYLWGEGGGDIATMSYFLCRSEKITTFLCDFPGYF